MRKKDIRILELRDITIAKVDYKGSFQGIGKAYKILMEWSRNNGLKNSQSSKTITIYHDDPSVVGMNNVRQSACIIIDKEIKPTSEISITAFKPGKCAVRRYELSYFEFKNAWTEMTSWVEKSNYTKAGDAFEVYQNDPKVHSQNKTVLDICIPIA